MSGYLSLRMLATYSGLSVRTLRSHLTDRSRPLPHFKIGGKLVIRQQDFDAWTEQFRVAVSSDAVDALVNDVLRKLQ